MYKENLIVFVFGILPLFAFAQANAPDGPEVKQDTVRKKQLIEELTYEMQPGLPLAASKIYFSDSKFTVSGFAEYGHTGYRGPKDRSSRDIELYMTDLGRFVSYLAYKPTPWLVLYGEVFVEYYHDAEKNENDHEIMIEAFADFLLHKNFNLRVGTSQVQLGYINIHDEPIQYFSVNRSEVERLIIPSQWIDLGVMAYGDVTDKLSWTFSVYQGLDARNYNGGTWIRRGRDDGFRANFNGYVLNGQLDYEINENTHFVVNGVWTRAGNNRRYGYDANGQGDRIRANTVLLSSYIRSEWKDFTFMALGSYGRMSDTDKIFHMTGSMGTGGVEGVGQVLGKETYGYYLEAGYDILSLTGNSKPQKKGVDNAFLKSSEFKLPLFFRYDRLNTHSSVHPDLEGEAIYQTDLRAFTLGLNFNPRRNIVLKANYQFRKNQHHIMDTGDSEGNRMEFGMGFIF